MSGSQDVTRMSWLNLDLITALGPMETDYAYFLPQFWNTEVSEEFRPPESDYATVMWLWSR